MRTMENSVMSGGANSNVSGQLPHMPAHISPDFQLFELVHKDDFMSVIINPQTMRTAHYEFLSQIRLTDYQSRFDTITVSEKMIADPKKFFKLMGTVTSERAFQEQLNFSNRSGRAQIDQPQWLEEFSCTYLTVWIAGLLEENLWAHYNYAHNTNIEKNVRKNDLANLFETRSETLQSQEGLSKHWHDIGNKGRQRLTEKLRQKAKEMPMAVAHDQNYLFGAEQYFAFEQAYGSEFGGSPFGSDETSSFYASQMGSLSRGNGYLNYNNSMQQEEMAQLIAGQAAASQHANGPPAHPFASQLTPGLTPSAMGMRPYQFYHLGDVPIRPQYARMYQDLLTRGDSSNNNNNSTNDNNSNAATSLNSQFPEHSAVSMPSSSILSSKSGQKEPVVADPDLKYITSYIQQKEPIVSSMDVIKFLSETPLDEMSHFALPNKTRKNALGRELLTYVQDDLRNHIQNQLIREDPIGQSSNDQSVTKQAQDSSIHGSGQSINSQQHQQQNNKDSGDQSNKNPQQLSGAGKKRRKNRKRGGCHVVVVPAATIVQDKDIVTSSIAEKSLAQTTPMDTAPVAEKQKQSSRSSPQQQLDSKTDQSQTDATQSSDSSKPIKQSQDSKTGSGGKMRFNRKTNNQQAGEDSKSQKATSSSYQQESLVRQPNNNTMTDLKTPSKQHQPTNEAQRRSSSCSDTQEDAVDDRVTEVSLRSSQTTARAGGKKKNTTNLSNTLGEAATVDTKTETYGAGQLTQSGSQSARKEHHHSGANLFQLTASQSVDLIKPSEQMRDASDSKAYSTKSSTALSASQTVVNSSNSNHIGGVNKHGPKKGGKEANNNTGNSNNNNQGNNQRRKKSNATSSANNSQHQRDTTLVKEFIKELIEKACDIAEAEELKRSKKQQSSTSHNKQKSNQNSGKKFQDNLAKELEETKATVSVPKQPQQRANKLTTVVPEDLGAMLARQESKMQAQHQKQAHAKSQQTQQKNNSAGSGAAAQTKNCTQKKASMSPRQGGSGEDKSATTGRSSKKQQQYGSSADQSQILSETTKPQKTASTTTSKTTTTTTAVAARSSATVVDDAQINQSNEENKMTSAKPTASTSKAAKTDKVREEEPLDSSNTNRTDRTNTVGVESGGMASEATGEQVPSKKRKKRNNNRKKPTDKLDAMNSFLLKMHGDGPSSSATANNSGTGNGKGNNGNGRSGQKRQGNNPDSAAAAGHRGNNKDGGQSSQPHSQKQAQRGQKTSDDQKGKAPVGGQLSARAANKTAKAEEHKTSQNSRQQSDAGEDNDQQPMQLSVTEMQKYATFTVNDSSPQDFITIPSQIKPVTTLAVQKDKLSSEKEQQRLSAQASNQATSSSARSSQERQPDNRQPIAGDSAPLVQKPPQEPKTKKERIDIKIDLAPHKVSSEKSSLIDSVQQRNMEATKQQPATKQKSADNGEKIVQIKITESFQGKQSSLIGKKLNSKEQIESAKADFRARFFELERQRTAEIREQVMTTSKEEFKGPPQTQPQHKSEENVQVNIECLDSSASKQKSTEVELSSPIDHISSKVDQESSDVEQDDQETSVHEEDQSEHATDQLDLTDLESGVSVSEVSASTENNPFMSTKAQSFMPTTASFVPSPNKTVVNPMVVPANQFSQDFSPSPLKPQTFGQGQAQPTDLGLHQRMPFKSLSVIASTKEELTGSARSGGSVEDSKAEGTMSGHPASSNPFKQSTAPLSKQKSMQVGGNFSNRNPNASGSSFTNDGAHGFKIPDSSFAFQPHNNSIPFGANAPFGGTGGYNQLSMAHSMSVDDAAKQSFNSHWESKTGTAKHNHGLQQKQGEGVTPTEGHKKNSKAPFSTNKPVQKFNSQALDRNSGNFGEFEGKTTNTHYNNKQSKTQYQAINRVTNDRILSYGEENKSGYKGKNNRMNLDFDLNKERSQHSPLKNNTTNASRQYSGEKKSIKKGSQLEQQQQKGPKSNRYKNNSKGSPDQYHDEDYPNILSKQNSQDSYSGTQLRPNLPLGQANNFLGSSSQSQNDIAWQTSPRSHNFTPGSFNNQYQSPMQQMPHMQFNNYGVANGNNQLNFGSATFNTAQGFQQEDEYNNMINMTGGNAPQLPVYGVYTNQEGEAGSMPQNGANQFLIKTQVADLLQQQLPKEEEIVAAAGLLVSKIDFEKLPVVEQDTFVDPHTKKQMEADPLYKNLEDRFYQVFDEHILRHTSAIAAKIQSFQAERTFVHNRIESLARTQLNCDRIVVKDFGSLITGLALESSDMDMAITGLEISDRTTLIEDMHTLTQALGSWDLVQELKSIETASIPVIKAKIDLREIRKLIKKEREDAQNTESDHHSTNSENNNNQQEEQEEESTEPHWLPIDITFDDSQPDNTSSTSPSFEPTNLMQQDPYGLNFGLGILGNLAGNFQNTNGFGGFNTPKDAFGLPTGVAKTHLGMASCDLLKKYVESYPCLREVGILLKEFLSLHDLNSAYRGGISSYSAILLIVAYMKNFKLQQSRKITPSRLLMGFLDFYSNCFDAKLYGINTLLEMSFYSQPPQSQQMFVIVDPVNPQNNTARNSHRTPDILKKFQEAFTHLKSLIQGEYLRLQKLKQDQRETLSQEMGKVTEAPASEEDRQQRQEDSDEVGSNGGPAAKTQQALGEQAEESETRSADSCNNNADDKAVSDDQGISSSNPAVALLKATEPAQQKQQQFQLAGADPPAGLSVVTALSSSMSSIISSPQLVQAASFTPQKGFASSAFLVENGAPSQQQVLEELPVKPFFFAAVDLIDHFLREETPTVLAAPGESRPGGIGAIKDDEPQDDRSSSNAVK